MSTLSELFAVNRSFKKGWRGLRWRLLGSTHTGRFYSRFINPFEEKLHELIWDGGILGKLSTLFLAFDLRSRWPAQHRLLPSWHFCWLRIFGISGAGLLWVDTVRACFDCFIWHKSVDIGNARSKWLTPIACCLAGQCCHVRLIITIRRVFDLNPAFQ